MKNTKKSKKLTLVTSHSSWWKRKKYRKETFFILKKYRRDAAEVLNKQAQEFKKSCRTRMTMETVERFKDKERCH